MDLPIKAAPPILSYPKSIFFIYRYGDIDRHKGLKVRRDPLFLIKSNYN